MTGAAAGKMKRQASIVWELRCGPLQLRCLVAAAGGKRFRIEAKGSNGKWERFGDSDDAWRSLRYVSDTEATGAAIKTAALRATMTGAV